ncbi:CheR family methyltransferase [Desulfovibrio ferrophilus]|uniref:protein-glutamate O-methyltransferase n=1 Tax=Desulfovibrio ferrophilus TaxID=241368 RepID=A0A2Z6B104_9BACT|nr:protein-glutamate O-methyltransferase CheR [Desulfovibrio ferrophilus]BBD09207.1 chemotaxis protein CheR [Desulfovibrio ferrophilus]
MGLLTSSSLTLRKTAKITDKEFEDLRKFIYDKTGIDIPIRRRYLLENRLGTRLKELNLSSFAEYHNFLVRDPNRTKEMDKLCEKITTNETSFFRDIKQLNVFRNEILPEMLKTQEEKGKKELNIWCAGCSSGEEPYTLAIMILEQLGMKVIGWRIKISAYDLSPAMLAKCRKGTYGEYSFKTTPKGMILKYFEKQPDGMFKVRPKVQKLVSFAPINLSDRMALKRVPKSQIVFCRNVIIYFDETMKKQVLGSFYDNLLPGGYLFLGHSESIHKLSTAYRPVIKPGGICYRKDA